MRRLQSFFLLLLIVLSYPNLSSAEEQTIYTIQCLSTADIKYAEEVLYPFASNAFIRTAYYKKVNIILENVGQRLQEKPPAEKKIHDANSIYRETTRQQEVLLKQQRQPDVEFYQSKKQAVIPQAETEEVLEEKPKDMKRFIKPAWQYFNQGNYKQAIEIFTTLSSFPETELEAKYGLAMCYVKLKEPKKAMPLLEYLIKKRFNLKDTLPSIIAILVEEKKYKKANPYLAMISERERKEWEGRIKIRMVTAEFEEAKKAGNGRRLIEFSEKNGALLTNCFMPDIFYETAGLLSNSNREYAVNIYKKLLEVCPDKQDLRLRILYSLKTIVTTADMLLLLENEVKAASDSDYKNKLTDIKISVLLDKLTALAPDSPELEDTAREMLVLKPEEEGARAMLAWWYFRKELYNKAYEEFHSLYQSSPETKDYIYGLVNTLIKLEKLDEALELAGKNKHTDERLASIEIDIYLDKANAAYRDKKYHEAETYFERALAENPQDMDTKKLLELSKYKQTLFSRAMSSIEGLPGYTWGRIAHDLNGDTGTGVSFFVNQGIDWVKLPGDIILNTFAEYRYRTRTRERRYFDESGQTLGLELKKSPFRLGAEYSWEKYTEQNKTAITKRAYLAWYHDWYKYMKGRTDDSWLKIEAFSGSTYGRITHDLENLTGTGISGFINQGIDWFTLPGGITLNTYAEYRFSFRTKDNFWYNSHGPALGVELQKTPFKFGMDYFWENYTEQNVTYKTWRVYFTWYYDWDLKPKE